MTVALLFISDGREEYLEQTVASIQDNLTFDAFDHIIKIDDAAHELGFAGAIQAGWEKVLDTGADYVWHAEQDFTYNRPVPIERMIALLERRPQLAQIVLKRQPWNAQERRAGGIVEQHEADYVEREDVQHSEIWTEHRRFFSTNPSVYPARLCRLGWPQEQYSEGVFTHRLLRDPLLRFAFWGAKFAEPMVTHIGQHRTGRDY